MLYIQTVDGEERKIECDFDDFEVFENVINNEKKTVQIYTSYKNQRGTDIYTDYFFNTIMKDKIVSYRYAYRIEEDGEYEDVVESLPERKLVIK